MIRKRVKIALNNDMTFIVDKNEDSTLTKYIVMGTGDDLDLNDVVGEKTTYSQKDFTEEVNTQFGEEFTNYVLAFLNTST